MKSWKKFLFFFIAVFLIASLFSILNTSKALISESQKETIKLFGDPPQFMVTYLPQESNKLVRFEIWYYPNQNKKISFLSGKIIDTQDWENEQEVTSSSYKPWDFDIYTSYDELLDTIGKENLNLLDLPGFSDENVQTYVSKNLVLILEDDYLTYVQTLAYDPSINSGSIKAEEAVDVPSEKEITEEDADFKTYSNSDVGFSIQYPQKWYLQNGVYSSYDTNYLVTGGTLPEKIFKCDFYKYDVTLELDELEEIQKDEVKIYKTSIIEENIEGPGYGDNVVFLFEKEEADPIILVCFFHSKQLEDKLVDSLKTFEFIE